MNQSLKNLSLWLVIVLVVIIAVSLLSPPKNDIKDVSYTEFLSLVEASGNKKIEKVTIAGREVTGETKKGTKYKTYIPDDPEFIQSLLKNKVTVQAKPESVPWYESGMAQMGILVVMLVVFWFFFMRQMNAGGPGKALSFGKSRAKLLSESHQKVTFEDVAGIDEAKEDLREIVDFLKDPGKFTRLGGRIPKGVLLMGAPGTGKTLLARAIAGEAEVPFFTISGSDFVEMFVGVGAARVRDLFEQAKHRSPCIVFVDEIDAVGRHRGAGLGGGHDEREQTLNQLLVEMDGFESNQGVILIAATNRPDVLDPALLRPGRFDRQIVIPVPDYIGREKILVVHTKRVPLEKGADLSILARGTPGFSGADLENMVNEAALIAAKRGKQKVEMVDLEEAKDKLLMGSERRSMIINDEEKRLTAYHESGHVLVAMLLPGTDPIHKVTIIPRGRALGITQQLPIDDRHSYKKDFLEKKIQIFLGGRVAEELVLGEISTGAGQDLEAVTGIARKMVCEWGMSANLGPLTFGKREEMIFLGREIAQHKDYSEKTAEDIDREVKRIVDECLTATRRILEKNLDKLHLLATSLLEKEVLSGDEITVILGNGKAAASMMKEKAQKE
ncbi:MAG: ATP-dependent zinc metalloprotease FtsH [Deltaproteobacteria bacterium]|nr:ATP-dependent zinc metalloprotease FtsH [Candidatus Zymogenaceae bacterium]